MQFRTEFKDAVDRAKYLGKLIKLLPKEGCNDGYRDVGDYQIKYHERKINVYIASGEEMEIAWGAGALSEFWNPILDILLADVQKEITDNIELLNGLGLLTKDFGGK
jgi:hypothetical protein